MIIFLSPTIQQSSNRSQSEGSFDQSEADPLAVRPRASELSLKVGGGVLHSQLVVAVGVHTSVSVAAGAATAPGLTQGRPIVRNLRKIKSYISTRRGILGSLCHSFERES